MSKGIPGGWNPALPEPPTPATAEVQALVNQLRGELQSKLNLTFDAAQAVNYHSQVVAGMNYLILVSNFLYITLLGDSFGKEYVHIGPQKATSTSLYALLDLPIKCVI